MRRLVFLLASILLLAPLHAAGVTQDHGVDLSATNQSTVLSISDLHFNPFFDRTLVPQLMKNDHKKWYGIFSRSQRQQVPGYGDEPNFKLLDSALRVMKAECPRPDFILFSGDLLAHSFRKKFQGFSKSDAAYKSFVMKTLSFISWEFQHYYPDTPIFFTLGNNDDYDDYKIAPPPADSFLNDTKDIFFYYYLKGDPANETALDHTFGHGGNYSAHPPNSKTNRIVALNAIFLSKRNAHPVEGWSQLEWLEGKLASAKQNGEKVWLVMHIPPGVDVKGTLSHPGQASLYWDDVHRNAENHTFLDKFKGLTKNYAEVIKAIFCGHTHMDHFRLVNGKDQAAKAYVHITPAVSPQFNNNPAFQILKYETETFVPKDFVTLYYSYANSAWEKEYAFGQTYGSNSCDAANTELVYRLIESDAGARRDFIRLYNVSSKQSPPITQSNWKAYWCGIARLTSPDFSACYLPPTGTSLWNPSSSY